MLSQEHSEAILAKYRNSTTIIVKSWALTEQEAVYDWMVGTPMVLHTEVAGHVGKFITIEDTNYLSRPYDRIVVLDRWGDHLTTINLTTVTKQWWETPETKADIPHKVRYTIDAGKPMAIYATEETLQPRYKRAERGYRPNDYHTPSNGIKPASKNLW